MKKSLLLSAVLAIGGLTASAAGLTLDTGTTYKIENADAPNLYLQQVNSGGNDAAKINPLVKGDASFAWKLEDAGDGKYYLVNQNATDGWGKYLTRSGYFSHCDALGSENSVLSFTEIENRDGVYQINFSKTNGDNGLGLDAVAASSIAYTNKPNTAHNVWRLSVWTENDFPVTAATRFQMNTSPVATLSDGALYAIYDSSTADSGGRKGFRHVNSANDEIHGSDLSISTDTRLEPTHIWRAIADGSNWKFQNLSNGKYIQDVAGNANYHRDGTYVMTTASNNAFVLDSRNNSANEFNIHGAVNTGTFWNGVASNRKLVSWEEAHPHQFYSVSVMDLQQVSVTVTYKCGATTVKTETVTGTEGDTYSYVIPDHYRRAESQAANFTFTVGETAKDVNLVQLFDVAITYMAGESEMKKETIALAVGDSYNYSVPAFFRLAAGQDASFTYAAGADTKTVEIEFDSLPFEFADSYADIKWQAVRLHSNRTDFYWDYVSDDALTKQNASRANSTDDFADTQLWGFVGNIFDGFKIYNKSCGETKTAYINGNKVSMGENATNNIWHPYPSRNGEGCCFYVTAGNYINMNVDAPNQLSLYTANDAGSTAKFFTPSEPVLAYYAANIGHKTNVVGGKAYDDTDLKAAKAAVDGNVYDVDAIATLRSAVTAAMTEIESAETVQFVADRWYRLETANTLDAPVVNTFMCAGKGSSTNVFGGETSERTNHYSLIQFKSTATEGQYNLLSQGMYFGHANGTPLAGTQLQQVDENGEKGSYSLESKTNCKYAIRDMTSTSAVNRSYLHHGNRGYGNQVMGWQSDADASQWYVHPATELDVVLTRHDDVYVGTGYFPFPVKATEGVKLYSVKEGVLKNTTTPAVIYEEVSNVLADTPFLMIGTKGTVTLLIDYDGITANDVTEQLMAGSYRGTQAAANDFVLDAANMQFKKVAEDTNVGENASYLPATNLSAAAAEAQALPVVDVQAGTTGIEEIGAEVEGNAVIFDLQGRRLAAPVRGINIINGRKVLVK